MLQILQYLKKNKGLRRAIFILIFILLYEYASYKESHRKEYFNMKEMNAQMDSLKKAHSVMHEDILPHRVMDARR